MKLLFTLRMNLSLYVLRGVGLHIYLLIYYYMLIVLDAQLDN